MGIVVPAPLLLQPDKLKELNNKLVDQTGCFAFIKTDQVLLATKPQSFKDAFSLFVAGLYVVYHDYGCRIITDFICKNEYQPSGMSYSYKEAKDSIERIEIMRHNIVHGSVYSVHRIELQQIIYRYYLKDPKIDYGKTQRWPDFINQLSDSNWQSIVSNLVNEADKVYGFIKNWGEQWAKGSHGDRIRISFGRNQNFYESYDQRVCDALLVANGVLDENRRKRLLKPNEGNISLWQQAIMKKFQNDVSSTPDALLRFLEYEIGKTVNPPAVSSVDTGKKYGFGIP